MTSAGWVTLILIGTAVYCVVWMLWTPYEKQWGHDEPDDDEM